MRKIVFVVLLVFLLAFAACSSSGPSQTEYDILQERYDNLVERVAQLELIRDCVMAERDLFEVRLGTAKLEIKTLKTQLEWVEWVTK